MIREIAWRLREIGNDGRICDLIDSQVSVIETGAEQISSGEAKAALGAAFAALEGRLAEFGDDEAPAPVARRAAARPPPAVAGNCPRRRARRCSRFEALYGNGAPAAAISSMPRPYLRKREAALADASAEASTKRQSRLKRRRRKPPTPMTRPLLDMIAMEMGAPDPIDDDEIAEPSPSECSLSRSPRRSNPRSVAQAPEPVAAPVERPAQLRPQSPAHATAQPTARARTRGSLEISLGSIDHRERHRAKAGVRGQRSAGADPAHEPGREDRVLLLIAPAQSA